MSSRLKLAGICFAAAFALAACGGGGGTATAPEPTPYETAMAAIAAATTAEAAQAAYDAVKDDVTAAQGERLQAQVDARQGVLATMARAAQQRMDMSTAAAAIDTSDLSTQDAVDAARMAIAALRQAIADAVDVDDTSMYQTQLDNAVAAVDGAQGGIDTATRRMNQMTALSGASMTLQSALAALSGSTPTQAQLDAANMALTALNAAITAAADLTDTEKAPYQREATNAAMPIQTAQMAFDMAEDEAAKAAAAAMAATAAKLHAGIYAPADAATGTAVGDVHAAYNDADAPNAGDAADTFIMVTTGDGTDANTQALSEDKDAPAATLRGWTRKRYTASGTGVAGTYEAHVYSHVGMPMQGKKFGGAAANDEFEYALTNGELTTLVAAQIASPRFTQTAGTMTFDLAENLQRLMIPGSYHGVSGHYYCTPTDIATDRDTCSAAVAAEGFTLAGGTWAFKPTDPNARVTSTPDASYASYGWWLHTAADGKLTASAFVDRKGAVDAASGLNDLNGTATYVGGAVGKYALSSTTGGTNDAGHFTARATLNANFTTNTAATAITGTIDQFVGADGMSRDWSVKLNGSPITDTGGIGEDGDTTAGNAMTEWTIGGTAADDSGSWTGSLQENGDDGVPAIATGTFHSTYGTAGKMIGAFGANKQ